VNALCLCTISRHVHLLVEGHCTSLSKDRRGDGGGAGGRVPREEDRTRSPSAWGGPNGKRISGVNERGIDMTAGETEVATPERRHKVGRLSKERGYYSVYVTCDSSMSTL
jgi:hypothetical protein